MNGWKFENRMSENLLKSEVGIYGSRTWGEICAGEVKIPQIKVGAMGAIAKVKEVWIR